MDDFIIQGKKLIRYEGTDVTVFIPSEVTEIGKEAFANSPNLESLHLPDGLEKIEEGAFRGSTKLQVTSDIPEKVKTIPAYAFQDCSGLISAEPPKGLQSIGECAFMNCTSYNIMWLKKCKDLKIIDRKAFFGCTNLLMLAFPDSLQEIREGAFIDCPKLRSVTIPAGCKVDPHAFDESTELTYESGNSVTASEAKADEEKKTTSKKPTTTKKAAASANKAKSINITDALNTVKTILKENQLMSNNPDITKDELLSVLEKEKFKGTHDVKSNPEWITPRGLWALCVPTGFTYSLDYDKLSSIKGVDNDAVKYDAEIQITGFTDFSSDYAAPFSLTVAPILGTIEYVDAGHNLLSASAQKAIDEYFNSLPGDFPYCYERSTQDIVIRAQKGTKEDSGNEIAVIQFFVICSGVNIVSGGNIEIDSRADDVMGLAKLFLNSIVKVPPCPQGDSFQPTVFPTKYKLTFNHGNELMTDFGFSVPIPDGYKGTTNSEMIRDRAFSVIEENQTYWNGGDQSYLPLDFSMMKATTDELPTTPDTAGDVASTIVAKMSLMGTFNLRMPIYLVRLTDQSSIFLQQFTDYGDTAFVGIRAMLLANKHARIFTIRMYFKAKIARCYYNLFLYESRRLATVYFNHIHLEGTELYNIGLPKDILENSQPATSESNHDEVSRMQEVEEQKRREVEEQKKREAEELKKRETEEQKRREAEEQKKREAEELKKREAEEQKRREQLEAERAKKEKRERIQKEIDSLKNEQSSLKGLFVGMKRKKIQTQIDELYNELKKI